MAKTLGQVAFEAWVDSHLAREDRTHADGFFSWEQQKSILQHNDWQAAAEAVVDEYERIDGDGIGDTIAAIASVARQMKLERAVIEAAKAHRRGWHSGANMDVLTDDLHKTVDALQEVEDDT